MSKSSASLTMVSLELALVPPVGFCKIRRRMSWANPRHISLDCTGTFCPAWNWKQLRCELHYILYLNFLGAYSNGFKKMNSSYYIRAGTSATANLLPVTAPVDPLLTLATLILPRLAQATVSRRAIIRWHSSHSSLKKLTSQSPVVAPEAACTSHTLDQVRTENYRILNPHFGHFQTSTVIIRMNQSLQLGKGSDLKSQNTANKN